MRPQTEPSFHDARRYLLGDTGDEELIAVEKALLDGGEFLEVVLAAEAELLDDYVAGTLAKSEETGFLQYLSRLPECEHEVRFARAFSEAIAQRTEGRNGGLARPRWLFGLVRLLATAAVVLVLINGAWALSMISTLHRDVATARAELERARARLSALETVRETAVFVLTSGTLRGAGPRDVTTLPLPRNEPLIEFRLDLGIDDYPSYRATIFDDEAAELLSLSGLTTQTTADRILVPFTVPAERIRLGDYFIVLSGIPREGAPESVARYGLRFRLKHRTLNTEH